MKKFGKAGMGALVSLSLISSKAFCCFAPQTNVTSFFANLLNGEARLEELGTNLLYINLPNHGSS